MKLCMLFFCFLLRPNTNGGVLLVMIDQLASAAST